MRGCAINMRHVAPRCYIQIYLYENHDVDQTPSCFFHLPTLGLYPFSPPCLCVYECLFCPSIFSANSGKPCRFHYSSNFQHFSPNHQKRQEQTWHVAVEPHPSALHVTWITSSPQGEHVITISSTTSSSSSAAAASYSHAVYISFSCMPICTPSFPWTLFCNHPGENSASSN